ncbi:uncharacterized protein LOC129872423 [Solanum dulcamara]|uniref:uncharacterized protein LOC129872423 n=1 Tax=Solanum dulcamara TaxID=45834 RepID=UPI0024864E05|nr:uncharacterized protein LOC129872423 [Solanum dulcamara]
MAPYEALYGRKCRSPIGWFDVGETKLIGPDLIQQAVEKVKLVQERLLAAESRQKAYTENRRRPLEFQVDDWIVRKVGKVAYELDLPADLEAVHPVFHVSMLRKFIGDPSRVFPVQDIQVTEELSYEEQPVAILDHQVRRLRTKDVASVKVLWRNNNREEMTWEAEEEMKKKYPQLFSAPTGLVFRYLLYLCMFGYVGQGYDGALSRLMTVLSSVEDRGMEYSIALTRVAGLMWCSVIRAAGMASGTTS